MNEIVKIIGKRLRYYRLQRGLSQEKLAELSGCHPTYIGQIERGEKNATIESVSKISSALGISLSQLFDKVEEAASPGSKNKIASDCYELFLSKSYFEQEQLLKLLLYMDKYFEVKKYH